jgi:hypothetical protein
VDTSAFDQITSSLTVKLICRPLGPDVLAGTPLEDLEELLDPASDPDLDPWNNPSRVIDADGRNIGMLWFGDWADAMEGSADDLMTRIEPSEILSSTTTILDAVELFGSNDSQEFFYVVHVNEVVGTLRYDDLFHPIGRLAFLAVALEAEGHALSLCQHAPIREQCWLSMSEGRKCKAIELFKLRYSREPKSKQGGDIDRLIACTNLADKANMIWKQRLINPTTRAEILGFFHELKTVRDLCAHPGTHGPIIPQEKLANFISSAKSMRSSLRASMKRLGVSSTRQETI